MEIVVLDFETTGLSPERHRVIEIGAVILNAKNEIVNTFQTICNPRLSKKLPKFIVKFTGITDDMLIGKPSTESAMEKLYNFIGTRTVLCHNASFDSKFLKSEMKRINRVVMNQFLCTLLISRRLLPDAGSYKLSSLKKYINFQAAANHHDHRALDDVLVTAALWTYLICRLEEFIGKNDHTNVLGILQIVSITPKANVASLLQKKQSRSNSTTAVVKFEKRIPVRIEPPSILDYFVPQEAVSADKGVFAMSRIAADPTSYVCLDLTRATLATGTLQGHIIDTVKTETINIGTNVVTETAVGTMLTTNRVEHTEAERDESEVAFQDMKRIKCDANPQHINLLSRVLDGTKRCSSHIERSVTTNQLHKRRRSLRLSNPF